MKTSKKGLMFVVILVVVLVGGVLVLQNVNMNRLGSTEYYTKIVDSGKQTEERDSQGGKHIIYEYELPAYDKEGTEKVFVFRAQKELKADAYLTLFTKDDKGVVSYEEIDESKIPEAALEKLQSMD